MIGNEHCPYCNGDLLCNGKAEMSNVPITNGNIDVTWGDMNDFEITSLFCTDCNKSIKPEWLYQETCEDCKMPIKKWNGLKCICDDEDFDPKYRELDLTGHPTLFEM